MPTISRASRAASRCAPRAPGERITLLDDQEYALDPEFMVIADESGAIGLAGIMGGRATAIGDRTTEVLLESAHFTPEAVAGRARRLGLVHRCRAALRARRRSRPAGARARARDGLLLEIAGGEPGPSQVTTRRSAAEPRRPAVVRLRRSRLAATARCDAYRTARSQAILAAIADRVETTPEGWRVRGPPHRFDIRIEADLIEEVARLRGFDSIAESHAIAPQVAGYATESRVPNDRLLTAMADRGYREAITYSFVDPVSAAPVVSRRAEPAHWRIRSPRI